MLFASEYFDEAYDLLIPHLGHKLTITPYGGDAAPDDLAIECEDCCQTLISFLPEGEEVPDGKLP